MFQTYLDLLGNEAATKVYPDIHELVSAPLSLCQPPSERTTERNSFQAKFLPTLDESASNEKQQKIIGFETRRSVLTNKSFCDHLLENGEIF